MSYYDVKCEGCAFEQIDFEQPMSVGFPTKCPGCKKKKLVRDYSRPCNTVFMDKTIRTVGQQAEHNQRKMGAELHALEAKKVLGEAEHARRTAPPPFWRKNKKKPLDVSKVKDLNKYIETGDKT